MKSIHRELSNEPKSGFPQVREYSGVGMRARTAVLSRNELLDREVRRQLLAVAEARQHWRSGLAERAADSLEVLDSREVEELPAVDKQFYAVATSPTKGDEHWVQLLEVVPVSSTDAWEGIIDSLGAQGLPASDNLARLFHVLGRDDAAERAEDTTTLRDRALVHLLRTAYSERNINLVRALWKDCSGAARERGNQSPAARWLGMALNLYEQAQSRKGQPDHQDVVERVKQHLQHTTSYLAESRHQELRTQILRFFGVRQRRQPSRFEDLEEFSHEARLTFSGWSVLADLASGARDRDLVAASPLFTPFRTVTESLIERAILTPFDETQAAVTSDGRTRPTAPRPGLGVMHSIFKPHPRLSKLYQEALHGYIYSEPRLGELRSHAFRSAFRALVIEAELNAIPHHEARARSVESDLFPVVKAKLFGEFEDWTQDVRNRSVAATLLRTIHK